jgi:hypothetical protein
MIILFFVKYLPILSEYAAQRKGLMWRAAATLILFFICVIAPPRLFSWKCVLANDKIIEQVPEKANPTGGNRWNQLRETGG